MHLRRLPVAALLLLVPALASPARAEVVARHGQSYLERVKDQQVLHLKGSYREMGLAHGKLLAQAAAENGEAFLDHWCVGGGKEKVENLRKIYDTFEPFLPQRYKDELAGLAEGSGIPLDKLQLLHAIPERFHCSGATAMKEATRDGKLYHTRSLDYDLNIGNKKRVQENALIVVYEPDDGHSYVVVGWAGFLGCVSGMNAKGISIGEMGSKSDDENFAGVPMIFLMRETLRQAGTLEEALAVFRKGPRTCGYNFILADGKIPDARAIEVTRNRMLEFAPGDKSENVGPHTCIPCCLRRVNHFVGEETAKTQRKNYDPREDVQSSQISFVAYDLIGQWLRMQAGKIDARGMIQLLRMYPPGSPCLHQVVFCPSDLEFWVSHAADPRKVQYAGAQNQPFYRYSLKKLLAREPAADTLAIDYKDKPRDKEPPVEKGKIAFKPAGDESKCPDCYRLKEHEFEYTVSLKHDYEGIGVEVFELKFPSPVETRYPENNTVYAEFYRPKGKGPFPCVIVLDILGGDQSLGRMQSAFLAQNKIAALFVQMAYYGPRRPKEGKVRLISTDVQRSIEGVKQTVLDLRRAAAWMESRPEIDKMRLGIMGTSLGSFVGALAAQAEPRLSRAVLMLSGGGLVEAFYEHPQARPIRQVFEALGGNKEKLKEVLAPVDPLTCAGNLKQCKLLLIGAKRDDIVPPAALERLWEASGKQKIVWYDCTHTGAVLYFVPAMQHVIEHFNAP